MNTPTEELKFAAQVILSFPRDVSDSLWDQGVNLDDWDYAILAPSDAIESREEVDSWDGQPRTVWEPKEYTLGRLLTGCCDNTWYKATIRGKEYAIGIAYHA